MGEEIKAQALGTEIKGAVGAQGSVAGQLAPQLMPATLLTLTLINKDGKVASIHLTDWEN